VALLTTICQPAPNIEIKKDAGQLICPVASGVSVVLSGNCTTVGVPMPLCIFIGIVTCDIAFFLSAVVRLRGIARHDPDVAGGD